MLFLEKEVIKMDKIRVNIYLSEDIKNEAMKIAKVMGISFSSFVSLALLHKIIENKELIKKR